MPGPVEVQVTLHPDGVAAPAVRAVEQSIDIVSFFMQSLDSVDLANPPRFESARIEMRFNSDLKAEERRARYTNWILSKGFQDLARGIRATLEEAYFYIAMVGGGNQETTWTAFHEQMEKYRVEAAAMSFPKLMQVVNNGLTSPLHFEKEFLSLQQVRNCLEHRDGIVGGRDINKDTQSLKLSLPQLGIYAEKDGKETEVEKGSVVEGGGKLIFRNAIQEREFRLGERIVINPKEFHDIGYGCWAFAQDLKSKLPTADSSAKHQPATNKKIKKLQARLPRGLADQRSTDVVATRAMIETVRTVYEHYGFEPVETPAFEYTDALGKFLPDQDRPNEGVFSFQDDDEQWLSLRYDLTAPLARYVAENFDTLAKPYRSYRYGYVFRNEKPGPGRFRQFMQFDADTVGSSSPAADAELCMMAADTMEALGIPRGSYVVKVSNRKVLDGLLESIGLGGEQHAETRLTVLRAVDKLDRLGAVAVLQLLTSGRKDESGDFTKGAGLGQNQAETVLLFLGYSMSANFGVSQLKRDTIERPDFEKDDAIKWITDRVQLGPTGQQGLDELKQIGQLIQDAGYLNGRVLIDPSVVRGLEYYTGPVFEVELTFSTDSKDGSPRFGSVGGGGRYDGLVSRFRGEPVPATGFSIGVSRLLAALEHLGKVDLKTEAGPVVVTVFDKDRIADYQSMVAKLRAAGIRAELYLGAGKFGPQMKYADRRNSPCVVIQGSDEKAKGEVTIKDLIVGAELAKLEKGREQHLQKQAEAQFSVPETDLVEAVRKVLARHAR